MTGKWHSKIKKVGIVFLTGILCIVLTTACSKQNTEQTGNSSQAADTTSSDNHVDYDSDDLTSSWDDATATHINFESNKINVVGSGAVVDGNKVMIQSSGTYVLSGTLTDGQIRVYTDTKIPVRLILNGVDISSSTSAPIDVLNAEKVIITLAEGTENTIADNDNYTLTDSAEEEPNAAIFSKSDLTINGSGLLRVDANYKNAITSKDALKIISGTIVVDSVNNGIIGRDYLAVKGGLINVQAVGDAIKATNDEDSSKGFILVEGGTLKLAAGEDGIQAETKILVKEGTLTVTSGGGSANGINKSKNSATADSTETSMKGIKAASGIEVSGGTITIDSADDAIHSNGSVTINNGTVKITSGDDGIHADEAITVNQGKITISKSYEGIESTVVTLNDGTIDVTASDDGINVAGGNDASSVSGRPGQNQFADTGVNFLNINGGYLTVDSGGDGLDSNGSITMTAGTVLVNGPTNNGNGSIDYNGTFTLSGGFLCAAGSAGMAEAPSTSSEQYALSMTFSEIQQAGSMVHIVNTQGEDILTFVPTKNYQNIVLSSSKLKQGETYTVYVGGSSTGTSQDGLYSGGTYTAGNQYTDLTISEVITRVGSSARMGPAAGGDRGPKGGMRR